MRQELSIWAAGLSIGSVVGVVVWTVIDATVKDTTAIGLAVSAALALAVAYDWTAKAKKRRVWRAAEAAAMSPSHVPGDAVRL